MKRCKKYEIHYDEWGYYWLVKVYKSDKDLRQALIENNIVDIEDIVGLVHPTYSLSRDCDIGVFNSNMFAMMYLSEQHLGSEVLCHECLHVAMAYERAVSRFLMSYGDSCGEHEERLAYFLGSSFSKLVSVLRDNNHIV